MTAGSSANSPAPGGWIYTDGSTVVESIAPGQPIVTTGQPIVTTGLFSAPVGDMLTLTKTAAGEFVLTGADAQRLLMEYFEQSPELWLRLLALKADKEEA